MKGAHGHRRCHQNAASRPPGARRPGYRRRDLPGSPAQAPVGSARDDRGDRSGARSSCRPAPDTPTSSIAKMPVPKPGAGQVIIDQHYGRERQRRQGPPRPRDRAELALRTRHRGRRHHPRGRPGQQVPNGRPGRRSDPNRVAVLTDRVRFERSRVLGDGRRDRTRPGAALATLDQPPVPTISLPCMKRSRWARGELNPHVLSDTRT